MSSASDFEIIENDGAELCYISRAKLAPDTTKLITPANHKQQVGFIAYSDGGEVQRHLHQPLERHLVGTSEVLFVRRGRSVLDVYDDTKELVARCEVKAGDLLLMVGGGHRLRMLEDTLFLEVKQGPYLECDETRHTAVVSHETVTIAGTTVLTEVHEDHDMRFFFPLELDLALNSAGLARSALTAFPEAGRPPGVRDARANLVARQPGPTLAEA